MNTPSKQNSIKQSLKSAFRKIPVAQWEIDKFKTELHHLLEITKRQITESEEYHKNNLKSFLQNTYCFSQSYYLNTKNKNDLVIHNSKEDNSRVGVIIETKKPNNRAEMLTFNKFNVKSLQQLIYYYLEERVNHNNTDLKHLIITDIYNWFIFDSLTFDDFFYKNNKLVKEFKDFQSDRLSGKNKDFFYKEIASKYINENQDKLKQKCTYFNFNDYHNVEDNKLISLYKILSPEHLLKLPFINDSNSLDKGFYNELLYIIGLEEVGDNKKIIQRLPSNNRKEGSLLENIIYNLQIYDKLSNLDNLLSFGEKEEEQLFNVSLQLVITWINRILFLKLLEAQLINYNQEESYSFLNINKINNFNDLDTLFFQVLAKKITDRQAINQEKFSFIPYLNSSLFEITELENKTLLIGNLNNEKKLPLFNKTILKDDNSNQKTGESNTLDYLFSFLSAYNFSSEGKEEIQQEKKTLINASVLGLIFEKINGYKDGSFFTPGFITMYMCKESIIRAVMQKFKEIKGWNCNNIEELKEYIEYQKPEVRNEVNDIINSLKICDPAVGSGHFLVSALNEIIALKSQLKILQDKEGKRIKEYEIEVENDELIIKDEDGELYTYKPKFSLTHSLQETLFQEKKKIIENCLFGVDININSVNICRLRLWIELLKNAYYKTSTLTPNPSPKGRGENRTLETLPNIDINIKCGNSLISRFDLQSDLKLALKKHKLTIEDYQQAIKTYHNPKNKQEKQEIEKLIKQIKDNFTTVMTGNDPLQQELRKKESELYSLQNQQSLFAESAKEKKAREKKEKDLEKQINFLIQAIEDKQNNAIYRHGFEWRFEFPEVLNKNGDFIGFDIVIGNPPYGVKLSSQEKNIIFYNNEINDISWNTAYIFIGLANLISKKDGYIYYIIPKGIAYVPNLQNVRKFLADKFISQFLVDTSEVFTQSGVQLETIILGLKNKISNYQYKLKTGYVIDQKFILNEIDSDIVMSEFKIGIWLNQNNYSIINKIQNQSIELGKIYESKRGIGINKFVKNKKENDNDVLIIGGKFIEKYYYSGQSFASLEKIKEKDKWVNQFPKIILQEIVGRYGKPIFGNFRKIKLNANIDYDGIYTLDTVVNLFKKDNSYSEEYILGLLNSKLISWYFHIYMSCFSQLTLHSGNEQSRNIPIKKVSEKEEKLFIKLVREILEEKRKNPLADTSKLEREIDLLVYQLYGLTEEEIKIIEGE